jgi:hypothetical protein
VSSEYLSIEERIPASHPLRRIRKPADQGRDRHHPSFGKVCAAEGRPSVPPERQRLASLLQKRRSHRRSRCC